MTWYKRKEPVEAGKVTAYTKESGHYRDVDVVENQYADVPEDEDGFRDNLLAESEYWVEAKDYVLPEERQDDVEEEGGDAEPEEEPEPETDEVDEENEAEPVTVDDLEETSPGGDLPPLEEADLDDLDYTDLQAYASLFDDVNGSQKTEELKADLDARR